MSFRNPVLHILYCKFFAIANIMLPRNVLHDNHIPLWYIIVTRPQLRLWR
uniref:Uncharacterized protein n=1 Tax=Arundo donax TaxID=35708 RepID=A0A0A9BU36_ARUDO